MTIKIAHLADTHLGYRQYGLQEREDDFYDSFINIVDEIIERKVDYVIHSGDLFDQPKPPIKALLVAQECFNKLMDNDIEVYVIAGNHDILQKRNTSLPQELYENEYFHILSTKENHFILKEDIYLTGIPYLQKTHEAKVKKMLDNLVLETVNHKHSIIMLHGGVTKFFEFNCEFELDTIPEGFDYYAMGHIHKRITDDFKNGIMAYPGSTDIKDKGEIQEYKTKGKGYTLLTIDEDIRTEYVNFELEREFIVKDIKYIELEEEIDDLVKEIENILLKRTKKPVLLLNIKEGNFDRSDVSARIYDKLGELSLTIRLSYEPTNIVIPPGKINEKLSPRAALSKRIKNELGEEFEGLGYDLYKQLSKQNIQGAQEISDSFYEEHYNANKGEEK